MKLHFICFPTEKQTRTTRLADVLWCPRATHFCSRLNTFATLWLAVDLTFSNKQHEAHPPLTPFRQIIIITPTVNWNRTLNETLLSPVTNATCSKLYIWTVFSHHLAGNVCKDLFFSTETINCESKWQYSSQPTLACCGHFSQPPLLFFCLGLFFLKTDSLSFSSFLFFCPPCLTCACVSGDSRSHPSLLRASAWRAQPPPLIPAAGAAARVLPRIWRGWATRRTNLWTTTLRECGALILNRASRRPWPSIPRVDAGRSSYPTRERCMVSRDVFALGLKYWVSFNIHY